MGEATVASCVVYDRQQMQKSEYRRFNIRDVTPGDDYAAMRQVLTRRYRARQRRRGKIPDLILIDGGKGQVGIAARGAGAIWACTRRRVVGVAKGAGAQARAGGADPRGRGAQRCELPPVDPGLHLIQQIRDEAHRFADRSGHRARRAQGAHHVAC